MFFHHCLHMYSHLWIPKFDREPFGHCTLQERTGCCEDGKAKVVDGRNVTWTSDTELVIVAPLVTNRKHHRRDSKRSNLSWITNQSIFPYLWLQMLLAWMLAVDLSWSFHIYCRSMLLDTWCYQILLSFSSSRYHQPVVCRESQYFIKAPTTPLNLCLLDGMMLYHQRKLGSNTSELRMTFTWWNWLWWRVVRDLTIHNLTIHNKRIRSYEIDYDEGW